MTPSQRVFAVLSGQKPDRPPLSFWYHFPPDAVAGPRAVQAHLDHFKNYQLDFLKVMNDNPYPHQGIVRNLSDLKSIVVLRGDEPEFSRQLELLSDLRRALGPDVLLVSTIFNAWAVLRHLIRPPTAHNPPDLHPSRDLPSEQIMSMCAEDQGAVGDALNRVAASLANFAPRCIAAGADGIYLSVRDDWVHAPGDPDCYNRLVRPADLAILQAASGARFNLLHVCGRPLDLRRFFAYPAHAINWADRAAGPNIASVKDWSGPAICCGIDNLTTLPDGTPDDVQRQVADALAQAGERPIMIAPGCTYDPNRVPAENLHALSDAVRGRT